MRHSRSRAILLLPLIGGSAVLAEQKKPFVPASVRGVDPAGALLLLLDTVLVAGRATS